MRSFFSMPIFRARLRAVLGAIFLKERAVHVYCPVFGACANKCIAGGAFLLNHTSLLPDTQIILFLLSLLSFRTMTPQVVNIPNSPIAQHALGTKDM